MSNLTGFAGMKECVEALAQKRGIFKSEAQSILEDVIDVICEKCVEEKGVAFKGKFTIKKKVLKGRTGSLNGKEWKTEDKNTLTISVGNDLDFDLNNK